MSTLSPPPPQLRALAASWRGGGLAFERGLPELRWLSTAGPDVHAAGHMYAAGHIQAVASLAVFQLPGRFEARSCHPESPRAQRSTRICLPAGKRPGWRRHVCSQHCTRRGAGDVSTSTAFAAHARTLGRHPTLARPGRAAGGRREGGRAAAPAVPEPLNTYSLREISLATQDSAMKPASRRSLVHGGCCIMGSTERAPTLT